MCGALNGHSGVAGSVAFSPDGASLATAGNDGTVRLWDVAARTPVSDAAMGHYLPVRSVRFGPDGRTLASVGEDDAVRLWDVAYTVDVAPHCGATVRRSLTQAEWSRYIPDVRYQPVCA